MRKQLLTLLVAVVCFSPTLAFAQLGQTAVLSGTITDTSGAVLPGVTVTVTSESLIGGPKTAVTDATGSYRFPAVPPGAYTLTADLAGFEAFKQNVTLQLGQTITVDFKMQVSGRTETVNVTAESPVIEVKSSAKQQNITQELVENIPFSSRFGPDIFLMAPGVNPNNRTAFGSGGSSSNAYMVDGVDVSDPEGGTQWLFAAYNWIQEVQVIGLGAPAEYGGFTGVASNSLFRSGSNAFHGLVESLYQNDKMQGNNITSALRAANSTLTVAKTKLQSDSTIQVGGPIKRDKLWFFSSFEYFKTDATPAGYPPVRPAEVPSSTLGPNGRKEISPRFLFKPTLNLGPNDKLTGYLESDGYYINGRGAGATVFPEATVKEDAPEVSWNGNYTRVLSPSSVLDAKYSGFWGYYYLKPYNGDTPGWFDTDLNFYSVNSYYFYNADRTRHQANVSVTKYASNFAGDHDLKFGAEIEKSYVKSELGYPGGMYVFAASGVPYYAYLWDGYLKDDVNNRMSVFAQDAWNPAKRLTINAGVRFDHFGGFNKHLDETVFKTNAFGPRVGFAFDVAGNGKTVLRGHYGWYYDGAKSTYYDLLDPQITPKFGVYLHPDLSLDGDPFVVSSGTNHTMDSGIKHPRLKQGILGVDHELFKNFAVGVTGVWRDNDQFIDDVLTNGQFTTRVVTDPGPDGVAGTADDNPSTSITTYRQTNEPLENQFLITNVPEAFRRYRGVEFSANKRMGNNWSGQFSWVVSKITGNLDNTGNFGNTATFDDPNNDPRVQPFLSGPLTRDNRHIAKLLGLYKAPFDVTLSGIFFYTSGNRFARTVRVTLPQGRPDLLIEPRGSQKLDDQPRLDVRAEKGLRFGGARRATVSIEAFNLFNNSAITSRTTRSSATYGRPTGVVSPRAFRVGFSYKY
jgi:Carboxypeptidase regulatory-like domain/TonB dependent receptor